jgi:hypothetical protein
MRDRERWAVLVALLPMMLAASAARAAEAWNCQFPGHGGVWQVDGGDLVAPPSSGAARFPIVRNTPDALVALTEEFSDRRFELVMLDRRRMTIKILLLGLDAGSEQREVGSCALPDARVVQAARTAMGDVRGRVRELVRQARSLADRGYTTSANLKLTEAQGSDRLTPDETRLIAEARQYVATKPRR